MKMPIIAASSPGWIALLLAGDLLAGCATSRSEVRLEGPSAAPAPAAASATKAVVIVTITDERVFEESPRNPSIPSLGFEGASKATEDVKSRAVARKRGGFGKAMGDVLLEDGQTVVGLVRENLTAAFKDAGYEVADAPAAGASPLMVDVHIRKFWGWFQPGFWAIALHCNIETQLDVAGAAEPVVISIHSEDSRQMATEGAWMEILQQALQTYRTEAKARLLQSPILKPPQPGLILQVPLQLRAPKMAHDVALITADRKRIEPHFFASQAMRAAAALPGDAAIVNLCEDRRKFLVTFAAAMLRRRTVLLPPSHAPSAVAELRARYPGSVVVDDAFDAATGESAPPRTNDGGDFIAAIGHTSGSTGAPVAHAKSFRSFAATTALNAGVLTAELARQGTSGRPWIVATVPPQHMYGLETSVLLPLLAGFGVHGGKPLLPADVAAALADLPSPRVLVSTPFHLRALVESSVAFPDIAIIVSATAPLDQDLAMRAEKRLGASLVEFFGSTETCVIATRRTALGSGWNPYPGVALAAGGGGTTVSAPWLAHDQLLHDSVEIHADGTFRVIGRGSDVIEVAGKRASLADLTQRLLAIEGVADAAVFQPSVSGESVAGRCAALVVAPGLSVREIARRMRGTVDAVFIPRPIVIVPALPHNEIGKLPREGLLEILASAASQPHRGR